MSRHSVATSTSIALSHAGESRSGNIGAILTAMTPEESVERIREMLAARGVSQAGALSEEAPSVAWQTFKEFSAMPVKGMSAEDDSDGLLFQTGVYDWHDGRGACFNFSLVRQYVFDDEDGEYDYMEQLEVFLLFKPLPELAALPREELWSFDKPLDEYFATVEALAGFRGVVGSGTAPTAVQIRLGEV